MKNKILSLLLSLVISFGLWLYVVTVISPESESVIYDIPVELVGKDYLNNQDLIIISATDNLRVDLTLRGNRSDLSKLNASNIKVIADLSQITYAGEHRLGCSVSFQSGTAEVKEQHPELISIVVVEKLTKTIPVKVTFTGAVPAGYEENREHISMDHTTVTISGPKQTVEKIDYASITVDLSNEMTTFVGDYPMVLCGPDSRPVADVSFVTTNVSHIRAVVQVNKVKRVALRFELDYTASGLDQNMVTIYPLVDTITLVGSAEALEKVDEVLTFTIALRNYTGAYTETFTPALPDGVSSLDSIMVHIQIPEMVGRWLSVNNFVYENVPDGMNLQVTDTPTIELWGPRDVLTKLTSDEVYGIVDCAAVSGSPSYAPITYVIPGYEYLYVRVDWNNSHLAVYNVEE